MFLKNLSNHYLEPTVYLDFIGSILVKASRVLSKMLLNKLLFVIANILLQLLGYCQYAYDSLVLWESIVLVLLSTV